MMPNWFGIEGLPLELVVLQAKAGLILGLTWLLARLYRDGSPAVRHAIWVSALIGVAVWPIAGAFLPTYTIEVPEHATTRLGLELPPPVVALSTVPEWTEPGSQPVQPGAAEIRATRPIETVSWWTILFALWLAGATLRLLWTGLLLLKTRWLAQAAAPALTDIDSIARQLCSELGIRRSVRVWQSARVLVPCTYGLIRPVVLLPASAAAWSAQRLRVVLLHELAHVRRWDYVAYLLAEVASALYWINPLVWLARRRVQSEQEQACDNEVLRHGVTRVEYAQHLVDIARSVREPRVALSSALSFAREITLKQRIQQILDHTTETPSRLRSRGAALLLLAACVLPVSALRTTIVSAPVSELGNEAEKPAAYVPEPAAIMERSGTSIPMPVAAAMANPEPAASAPAMVSARSTAHARGAYVWLAADALANKAQLVRFAIEHTGRYQLWARVRVRGRDATPPSVSVDGIQLSAPADRDDDWRWTLLGSTAQSRWVELATGEHELRLAIPNSAELNGLLLTTDEQFRPRGSSPLLPPAQAVNIALNAEAASVSAPFVLASDRRGNTFLRVSGDEHSRSAPPAAGSAVFYFDVPQAGSYRIWARTRIDDDDEDSFWVRVNGKDWIEWNDIEDDDDWRWSQIRDASRRGDIATFELPAGSNRLEFAYRERGARLDRILVTNDPDAAPQRRRGRQTAQPQN